VYTVEILPAARKALRALDPSMRRRIEGAIALLAIDPHPPASRRLVERDGWRVRIGDYRVIYRIEDSRLVIVVVVVGHRREVYRRWHGE